MNRDLASLRLQSQRIASGRVGGPGEVVAAMGAIQAQDYRGSLWGIGLRTPAAREEDVERAIADGTLVRTWPMRGTLHFVHAADIGWMLRLLAPRVIAASARRFQQLGLNDRLIDRASVLLAGALEGGNRLTRKETYAVLEADGIDTTNQRGYQLLWRIAQSGLICCGPRQGKQPTFMRLDGRTPDAPGLTREEALAHLADRYFSGHGPATVRDLAWWSGLTIKDARIAATLAGDRLTRQTHGGDTFWSAPAAARASPPLERAFLLPPFDEFLVGYRDRDAVLDPADAKKVNAGGGMLDATIVVDGLVVGTWKRTFRKSRVIIKILPFRSLSSSEHHSVAEATERFGHFLDMPVELTTATR